MFRCDLFYIVITSTLFVMWFSTSVVCLAVLPFIMFVSIIIVSSCFTLHCFFCFRNHPYSTSLNSLYAPGFCLVLYFMLCMSCGLWSVFIFTFWLFIVLSCALDSLLIIYYFFVSHCATNFVVCLFFIYFFYFSLHPRSCPSHFSRLLSIFSS